MMLNHGLFRKELVNFLREPSMWLPMLILPMLFSVVFPVLVLTFGADESVGRVIAGADSFMDNLSPELEGKFQEPQVAMAWALFNYFFAPIFMLFPVIFGTITASYSFVGERVENTLENLLQSPLTVRKIAVVKLFAAWIPSILVSWISISLYIIVVNILGFRVFDRIVLVNMQWFFVALLAPIISFTAIGLVMMVSQRAKSIKGAQSVAMVGVLPILGLVISQAAGAIIVGVAALVIICLILVVIDLVLIYILGHISEEKLLLA